MIEFLTVLSAVLPVVCMAVAGVAMRLLNWLTAAADGAAMQAQQTALAADAGFVELLDSTGGAYAEDVAATQSVMWRRLS
jgi:hypothetical protein